MPILFFEENINRFPSAISVCSISFYGTVSSGKCKLWMTPSNKLRRLTSFKSTTKVGQKSHSYRYCSCIFASLQWKFSFWKKLVMTEERKWRSKLESISFKNYAKSLCALKICMIQPSNLCKQNRSVTKSGLPW